MPYRISAIIFIIFGLIQVPNLQGADVEEAIVDDLSNSALDAIQAMEEEGTGEISAETAPDLPPATPDITEELTDTETPTAGIPEEEEGFITDTEMQQGDEGPVLKDVILVLDNSGSMKKNDPQFLTSQAVTEFITQLDEATRVAIIIFDKDVEIAVPLTSAILEARETILQSLDRIDYNGQYTDSPAAIERAIYDLKTNGRSDAKKLIVFMTDGIVDTGNADQDLEKARWLKQDLAEDAADSDIKIFGIAFTDKADFQLIQSLAQKTDGEYFRALQPENLQDVFDQIQDIINRKPEPVVTPPESQVVMTPPPPPPPPPEPVIIEVPVQQPQAPDEEERFRSIVILVALVVLILAVILMIFLLVKGGRKKGGLEEPAQEAYINDIHGHTKHTTYKLGAKPTMMGRVAGKDTEQLDYIVIPESTIGRRHALIEYKDFAYWIIDQGSINGTFVNDQPATAETRLKHGDKIRLHKCEFEFLMPDMDAGETVISKTVIASGKVNPVEDSTVALASSGRKAAEQSLEADQALEEEVEEEVEEEMEEDLPEPDFDLDVTGDMDIAEEIESAAPVAESAEESAPSGDGQDETIMLSDDDMEENLPEETIRRDEEDDDMTVDDVFDSDENKKH